VQGPPGRTAISVKDTRAREEKWEATAGETQRRAYGKEERGRDGQLRAVERQQRAPQRRGQRWCAQPVEDAAGEQQDGHDLPSVAADVR
jgi:hypothetical protein